MARRRKPCFENENTQVDEAIAKIEASKLNEEILAFETRLGLRIPSRKELTDDTIIERTKSKLNEYYEVNEPPPLPLRAAYEVANSLTPIDKRDLLKKLQSVDKSSLYVSISVYLLQIDYICNI